MSLEKIQHFVVLMEENRSFDNLLGGLYRPEEVPTGRTFEGVLGRSLSLPIPPGVDRAGHRVVEYEPTHEKHQPTPDPGEEWQHVNTQLYGIIDPLENAQLGALEMRSPYNLPDPLPPTPPMNGFLLDYCRALRVATGRDPTFEEHRVILQYHPPEAVPVLSTLAREFAVCDHYFAAVPSQTFPNRSFFHAATSSGWANNVPYENWIRWDRNHAETIFDRLDQAGHTWRVYWDPLEKVPLTALLHHARLWRKVGRQFASMDQFYSDVARGSLPEYSFIEPRFLINSNDMHPPIETMGHVFHSSILAGEELIATIYRAIRRSSSPAGNNWGNTAFLLTFDEHGGNFDHVPPPRVSPPTAAAPAGQFGFRFDRLGLRVPMIIVSAYTDRQTIINTPLDSASFLKTLEERWDLRPLTERDRTARSLSEAFNRDSPRSPDTWPDVTPLPVPMEDTEVQELTPIGAEKLRLFAATLSGAVVDETLGKKTMREALTFIQDGLKRLR